MSLSGSWMRRPFSWFSGGPEAATTGGRRVTSARPRTRARSMARDFRAWEMELQATAGGILTTVIGGSVVHLEAHRPIEEIATHLRRLRSVIDAMPEDVSFVRWDGVFRAYDDFLAMACRELAVPTDLMTIGFGRHRDEERCRLERVLHGIGLPVR